MNNDKNTYEQGTPWQGQMPPLIGRPKPRGWRERFMQNYGQAMGTNPAALRDELTIPKWLVSRSVLFFFIAFAACITSFKHGMPWDLAVIASASVLFFFYGIQSASRSWLRLKERQFIKKAFVLALVIRLIWVCISYFYLNTELFLKPDGYGDDNGWYMDFAQGIAKWLKGEDHTPFSKIMDSYASTLDDTGYPFILALEYLLSMESSTIFVPLLVKVILDAYICVAIYHIARRHFGVGTARTAMLFMVFNPIMLFWASCLLKECEMVFICVVSINMIDSTLSAGKKISFRGLLPGLAMASLLFFFRTALALVIFLAVFAHIIFVSHKVMSNGKKVLAGVLVGIVMLVGLGDRITSQSKSLYEKAHGGQQKVSMDWRAEREGGNSLAKYASATVFAPLIFTIPFPTFNMAHEGQIMQMELSGGYFIKNALSFFVIFVLLLLLISGEWRKHVFIEAYTVGYLLVLVMSEFAQSGRFHMPVFPMLMLFAAYGLQVEKGNKHIRKWYLGWCVLMLVAAIGWNWFKLKGRGMI